MIQTNEWKNRCPSAQDKGIEVVLGRITPHEPKFAPVLSPGAFLQGWTLALARSLWVGCAGFFTAQQRGWGLSPGKETPKERGSVVGIFSGGSGIPSQHRKATCACS